MKKSVEDLEIVRKRKKANRGGFAKRIFLEQSE